MDPQQNQSSLSGGGTPARRPSELSTTIQDESAQPRHAADPSEVVDLTDILSSESEAGSYEVDVGGVLDQEALLATGLGNDQAMQLTKSDPAWNDSVAVTVDKPASPSMVNVTDQQQNPSKEAMATNGEVFAIASALMLSLQLGEDRFRDKKSLPGSVVQTSCDLPSLPDTPSGSSTTRDLASDVMDTFEAGSLVVTNATDANTDNEKVDTSSVCDDAIDADVDNETNYSSASEETMSQPSGLHELRGENVGRRPKVASKSSSTQSRSPVEEPASAPSKPIENASVGATGAKVEKKRKGSYKPTKRILFGKNESFQATEFIRDKGDLADCLTPEECLFLGETFWIFTVEQLAAALKTENSCEGKAETVMGRITEALKRRDRTSNSSQEETAQATAGRSVQRHREGINLSVSVGASTLDAKSADNSLTKTEQPENCTHQTNDSGKCRESSSAANGVRDEEGLLHHQATEIVRQWRDAVKKQQSGNIATKQFIKERFHLETAAKFLIPAATLNFLKSMKIETVWSFLSLKKSETGAICELMNIWREACGLAPLSHSAIAKHFSGVQTRIELAFSAIPCVTPADREWMKDSIVGMTGAAKEFLIVDQGYVSAAEFASKATKPIADELEKWREAKGMEPLKGSGKFANISAWKAQAKEAVEAEANAGRVIADLTNALSGNSMPTVHAEPVASAEEAFDPPAKRRRKPKKSPVTVERSVDYALHSKTFLDDTLGDYAASILAKADIKTAADLFDVDIQPDSMLHLAVLDAGIATSVTTFKRVIDAWRAQLRKNLDQLGQETLAKEYDQPKAPERSSKRSLASFDDSTTTSVKDPLDWQSSTTRDFLNSIGITTAAEFLMARTTDISAEFVKWRAAEGKSELRGLGAIASVSGWKSSVRTKAKELGLNELAELDPRQKSLPHSRAPITKSVLRRPSANTHPQSPATAKRAKRSKQQNGERNMDEKKVVISQSSRAALAAEITLPPGASLVEDGKALFAVQHRELHGHFVFLLSVRNSSELFVSYRGFGPRSGVTQKASRVCLELANTEPDELRNEVPNWVLADVSINQNATSSSSEIDLRMPFCASRHGCGLIEIGKHGGYPYRNQDLSLLKDAIESLVLSDLETFIANADHGNPGEKHNVLLEKVGHDSFHYLLHLEKPIELGQSVAVVFPSLVCALSTRKYDDTEFRRRHIIDEAIRTLSLEDLRSLLLWLHDHGLALTGYSASLNEVTDSGTTFQNACERRRRLCWVSRRVRAAIGLSRVSRMDAEVCDKLEFGRRTMVKKEEWDQLSQQRKDAFTEIIRSQLSVELQATLEFELTCGAGRRLGWCARSLKLFNSVLECAIESYFYTPQSKVSAPDCRSAMWSSLAAVLIDNISSTDFTNGDMLGDFVVHESASCSSDGRVTVPGIDKEAEPGYLDALVRWNATPPNLRESVPDFLGSVACIGEKKENEPYSVVMRFPAAVRAGRSYLSGDWYRSHFWRIVAAVLSAFSGNLGCNEAPEYEIDKILSLAGPLVISREAFRSKPIPVSYQQRLMLPQSGTVDEYVPSAQPLFLGLVWPALRNIGWHLEAGDSPSQVFFHPRGSARKHSVNLKRRRDHNRLLLKKQIMEAGLGRHSKTCKRLILAIVDNGYGNSHDISGKQLDERSFTVADVLEHVHAFLAKKATKKDGIDQSSKISAVLKSIGTCFDSIAHHFTPIHGLKGASDVGAGQRPINVYSGEYMMQLLFALPDVLQHEDIPQNAKADVLEIARDLQRYICAYHDELFAARFRPPPELYVGGDDDLSSAQLFLESKIAASPKHGEEENLQSADSSVPPNWLPGRDLAGVTDFIFTIFEQVVPCRATSDDLKRKGRRLPVGFPGVCCRHCLGQFNEGRYFFSTQESLASCYTGLEKHFLRCPSVPEEIKQKIVLARSQHAQQRQAMKFGAQQNFFKRMWEALPGATNTSTLPDYFSFREPTTPTGQDELAGTTPPDDKKSAKEAFSDHRSVLDHLRSNNKVSADVEEALDRYYSALDYGGRIYQTSEMPDHFSAEWLIAKLVPKRASHVLRNVG